MTTEVITVQIQIAVSSKIGGRERNEDACGFWGQGGPVCCVLSDGAGGHGGGDVAARTAVNAVLDAFVRHPQASPADVRALIERANADVMRAQLLQPAIGDMRATLVVLEVDPLAQQACWGHIGDSRLYCFRQGYVLRQTKDHSLYQSMIDAGFAHPDNLRGHVERTVLTASLGGLDGFQPDVPAAPFAIKPGDAFLMCSDGFWEHVDERAMESALQATDSPDEWIGRMEALIEAAGRVAQDNYSAVALRYGELDFVTRIPSAQ